MEDWPTKLNFVAVRRCAGSVGAERVPMRDLDRRTDFRWRASQRACTSAAKVGVGAVGDDERLAGSEALEQPVERYRRRACR